MYTAVSSIAISAIISLQPASIGKPRSDPAGWSREPEITRETLHHLIDRTPERELPAAQRFWSTWPVTPPIAQRCLHRQTTSQSHRPTHDEIRLTASAVRWQFQSAAVTDRT